MAELRTVLTGLGLGESPRWHEGRLWFCDWGAGEIVAADEEGRRETIARMPSFPFCIDWLPDGRLVIVNGRRVLRREPDGTLATHAELAGLSRHGFNDIAVDGRGNVFVNCVNFAFPGGAFAPGFVARVAPDGSAREVAGDLGFPNGMLVTPDGSTLVVAESFAQRLTAFDIARDGTLSGRRTWAELPGAAPDGICLDAEGAIWFGEVPGRRCVRVREGGEVLQEIALDRGCFACTLGGADGRTLFLTAARWPDALGGGERTGLVLAARAPAPAAARDPAVRAGARRVSPRRRGARCPR